ncbi:MAG: di-heme oxidoredictase family protein [Hyphomicrobium sp.]
MPPASSSARPRLRPPRPPLPRAPAAAYPNALEPGEDKPGGNATSRDSVNNRDAFSHFSHGIGFEGEGRFKIGNAIFRRLWVSAPSSTESADGLGPLYNARGCQNCHLKDGRGRPPRRQLAGGRRRLHVPASFHSARDR